MKSQTNTLTMVRKVDGYTVRIFAVYLPNVDGWIVTAKSKNYSETRTPDQTGNDTFATMKDMLSLAENAENAANLKAWQKTLKLAKGE